MRFLHPSCDADELAADPFILMDSGGWGAIGCTARNKLVNATVLLSLFAALSIHQCCHSCGEKPLLTLLRLIPASGRAHQSTIASRKNISIQDATTSTSRCLKFLLPFCTCQSDSSGANLSAKSSARGSNGCSRSRHASTSRKFLGILGRLVAEKRFLSNPPCRRISSTVKK